MEFPALSIFPLTWEIKETEDYPTMATDGVSLLYNKEFVDSITEQETVAVLIHEIFHCILLHPLMLDKGFSKDKEPIPWTLAIEQVTNSETISTIKQKYKLPGQQVSPEEALEGKEGYIFSYRMVNKSEKEIYDYLKDLLKKNPEVNQPNNSTGNSTGNSTRKTTSNILSDDVIQRKLSSEEQQAMIEKSIATIKKIQKEIGNLSPNLERLLEKLTTSQIPWERILQRFISRVIQGYDELSPRKPNTKHPLTIEGKAIIPSRFTREIDAPTIVLDTSASISTPELTKFASEIQAILKKITQEIALITTDIQVNENIKIKSFSEMLKKVKFRGGGGTDFTEVFEKVKKTPFMIFFTDGYATYPKNPPKYPVLWVLTKKHLIPPFGKVAFMLDVE